MKLTQEKLRAEAETTGFRPEVLEKVIHLLNLLEGFRSHPYLKGRLTLKGGTALNLFVFDMSRLSVDIDLNYIGAIEREAMLAQRPKVEQAIQAVCAREDIAVQRVPADHAGRNDYAGGIGQPDAWARRLVDECRSALGAVLPLSDVERAFLDRLLDHGEIVPSILTADAAWAERIKQHPLLEWKALNVRQRGKR